MHRRLIVVCPMSWISFILFFICTGTHFPAQLYLIRPNYNTYPFKQFLSIQITARVQGKTVRHIQQSVDTVSSSADKVSSAVSVVSPAQLSSAVSVSAVHVSSSVLTSTLCNSHIRQLCTVHRPLCSGHSLHFVLRVSAAVAAIYILYDNFLNLILNSK